MSANRRMEIIDLDLTPRCRRVVEATRRVAARVRDRMPLPREIADEMGEPSREGPARVRGLIGHMRGKGQWPPRDLWPDDVAMTAESVTLAGPSPPAPPAPPLRMPADAEVRVISIVIAAMEQLDGAARGRAWRYLCDRFGATSGGMA